MQPCPLRDVNTPWPLKPNEIIELAKVIEVAINHFNQYKSSSQESYFTELRIVNHCYYLVQIELGESSFYSHEINFNKNPEQIASFALNMADRINMISDKVRLLDYPWFYPHFSTAVKKILSDKIAYLSHDLTKIHCLLNKIIRNNQGSK